MCVCVQQLCSRGDTRWRRRWSVQYIRLFANNYTCDNDVTLAWIANSDIVTWVRVEETEKVEFGRQKWIWCSDDGTRGVGFCENEVTCSIFEPEFVSLSLELCNLIFHFYRGSREKRKRKVSRTYACFPRPFAEATRDPAGEEACVYRSGWVDDERSECERNNDRARRRRKKSRRSGK